MRIYLSLSRNNEVIPYNYQQFLTGAIHKWLGKQNDLHNGVSLYSFSWLQNVKARSRYGINLTNESYFFISAYSDDLIKRIIKGIMTDPVVCFGAAVSEIQLMENQQFNNGQLFHVASPVLIKRQIDKYQKHFTYNDPACSDYLTETLKKKLNTASVSTEGVSVSFDTSYHSAQTKIIHYKKVGNRVNICPVIIKGTPEQLQFAWNVGIGNSTGIGFGALK